MRPIEADYRDGVLRPTKPLQQSERWLFVVLRRPDSSRWSLERLARSGADEEALAREGMENWASALDGEDED